MKQIFAALAACAALSVAGLPAQAQTFRDLMEDIGLQKRKTPDIDFNERAPLVVPPSLEALPPPQDKPSLASVNPNWPHDPDDQARADEEAREKLPNRMTKYKKNAAKEIYKIRAREREEGAAAPASTMSYETNYDRNKVMTPDELRKVRDERAAAPQQVYVEPERKRLTDPPPGYRTPSSAQPFGPGEKDRGGKNSFFSKINPFD